MILTSNNMIISILKYNLTITDYYIYILYD